MKRWAVLTVFLYSLTLALLTVPVAIVIFGKWWGGDAGLSVAKAFAFYRGWFYWICLAVLALGQALLLLVPVDVSERRLPARRKLVVPIVTAAFFLMSLFVSGVFALLCAIFKDNAFKVFEFYNRLAGIDPDQNRSAFEVNNWLGLITVVVVCWIVWGLVFYRSAKAQDPDALTKRVTRWLLRGSILELLVAVPSHIIVRNRNDCCAPAGTFWGITTGLSIMLLSFGPGVFFLFVERIQRSRPKPSTASPQDSLRV